MAVPRPAGGDPVGRHHLVADHVEGNLGDDRWLQTLHYNSEILNQWPSTNQPSTEIHACQFRQLHPTRVPCLLCPSLRRSGCISEPCSRFVSSHCIHVLSPEVPPTPVPGGPGPAAARPELRADRAARKPTRGDPRRLPAVGRTRLARDRTGPCGDTEGGHHVRP